jgi:trehalose utilization protein
VSAFPETPAIRTAVITGNHPFDVPAFHTMLRALPQVDFYLQDLANLVADTQGVLSQYDVLLFYSFHQPTPEGKARATLERLGTTEQGIVVLHHALLAFPEWPLWSKLCDVRDRATFSYYHGQTLDLTVADPTHPITEGMASWRMVDETYLMEDAGKDSHVLLTTDHPKSMRTIAWTRQVGQARVLCTASGHDHQTYADPHFRRFLARGIHWAAGRM